MNKKLTKYKQNMNNSKKQDTQPQAHAVAVERQTFYLLIYNILFVIISCYIMG